MITWLLVAATVAVDPPAPGFRPSAWFDESVREQCWADGVRVVVNAPKFKPDKPTKLVVYATPNGNTIEQTLGCAKAERLDWHFDIQHVAAQIRRLRELTPDENVVLACLEAEGLSWPAWKRRRSNGPARIRAIVEELQTWLPGREVRVALTGHSGGGSFLFGFIDAFESIPPYVDRIVFVDANYSYSDADRHGDKLLDWLTGDRARRLVVLAYDDRNVTLNGKRVVGPDGGTFRATERMAHRFAKHQALSESTSGPFRIRTALDGRLALIVHGNPENRILHTALVGEMNGLLCSLQAPTAVGGPPAYINWIQPAPRIPPRPTGALAGQAFIRSIQNMTPADREEAIAREVLAGNIPEFLRRFHRISLTVRDTSKKEHSAIVEVMPDYLAIGGDADFVRMPMTPMTAASIADAFGCALPTRRIVDAVYRASTIKLAPQPLTEARESPATFLQHHGLIEEQRKPFTLGDLVAGIKKDVVVTNRLAEKPNRVAIYGWHKLDGAPIQPLTTVHSDRYVDYSHGVRLMKRTVVVDAKAMDVLQVLLSPDLHPILSDEGPVLRPTY